MAKNKANMMYEACEKKLEAFKADKKQKKEEARAKIQDAKATIEKCKADMFAAMTAGNEEAYQEAANVLAGAEKCVEMYEARIQYLDEIQPESYKEESEQYLAAVKGMYFAECDAYAAGIAEHVRAIAELHKIHCEKEAAAKNMLEEWHNNIYNVLNPAVVDRMGAWRASAEKLSYSNNNYLAAYRAGDAVAKLAPDFKVVK